MTRLTRLVVLVVEILALLRNATPHLVGQPLFIGYLIRALQERVRLSCRAS
jgi:hypothetical protein